MRRISLRPAGLSLLLAAGLLAGGCQRDSAGGPVELTGKIFIFNYRVATATAVVTLAKNAALPEGTVAVTTYENPAGGAPIVTETKIFSFWQKIALESPPLHCIVKDRPYRITVTLKAPDGTVIQTVDTTLTSSLDQTVMPGKPLVVGPIYTRNPDVYKSDGTVDYGRDTCPAPPLETEKPG